MNEHITLCRQLHEAMPELKTDFEWTPTDNVEEGLYYDDVADLVKISTKNIVYLKDRDNVFPDFTSDDLWKVLPTKTRLEKFTIWGDPDKRRLERLPFYVVPSRPPLLCPKAFSSRTT